MRERRVLFVAIAAWLAATTVSCGGGSSGGGNQNSMLVQITEPQHTRFIDQGQNVKITAQVLNDSGNAGVTWTVGPPSKKGQPIGTLSGATKNEVTYTAPDTIAQETQVTVTATSITDPTSMAVVGIVIEPAPLITTQTSDLKQGMVGLSYESDLFIGPISVCVNRNHDPGIANPCLIRASGGVGPYSWFVVSGGVPDGLELVDTDVGAIAPLPGHPVVTNSPAISVIGTPKSAEIASFTIQLTDATGVVTTRPLTISVGPKALKTQVPTMASGTVNKAFTPVALTVAIGSGVPPYTWTTQSGGSFREGMSMSSDGVISGTPTMADITPGVGTTTPVLVTDSQTPIPAVGIATVTITVNDPDDSCDTGDEAMLSSTAPYAFLLRGFDASGPVAIAGSFQADGAGHITGGVEDINRSGAVQTNLSITSASSYTFRNSRGCLTLVNSAGSTTGFRFSMGRPNGDIVTTGHMIEFDDAGGAGTRASGDLHLQTPSAFSNGSLSGVYAFGLSGRDSSGGRFAMAGSANAGGGTLTAVAADLNDAGTVTPNLTGGTGTYNVSANGRGTGSFTVGSSTFNLALYVVDSKRLLLMTTDALNAAHPLLGGEAAAATGSFSASSLKDNYVFYGTGVSSAGPEVTVGILGFDAAGKFAATHFINKAGTIVLDSVTGTNVLLPSGVYAIDATTGRTTLSGAKAGAIPPVIYATGATSGITGFSVGTDTSASAGRLEYQVPNPPQFITAAVKGAFVFGTQDPADASTTDKIGVAFADGAGGLTGLQDTSAPGRLDPNQLLTGKFSVLLDGSGTFGGNTASVTNGSTIYYLDQSPLDHHPSITVMEK